MNLRRLLTALVVMAVFAALASAQGGITSATVTCTVSAASAPTIRLEGLAERVGDLKLTCTGGLPFGAGTYADRATIVVDYGVAITSKADTTAGNTSSIEAALVIDEPGTLSNTAASTLGISGYGPNAGLAVCPYSGNLDTLAHAQANYPAYAEIAGGYIVSDISPVLASHVTAANAYQGQVGKGTGTNTQLTFTNIPLIPPSAAGVTRVYRIVNVRVTPGAGPINATVTSASVTGGGGTVAGGAGSSTLVATGSALVATPAASLTTSLATAAVSACVTTALAPGAATSSADVALLKFGQNFAGAFKTRVVALDTVANFGYGPGTGQISATGSYTYTSAKPATSTVANNSESGVLLNFGGTLTAAGLADTGTRLKAVFANLDANATYWVSLYNVNDFNNEITGPTTAIGDGTATPYAVQQKVAGGETAAWAPEAIVAANLANKGVAGGGGVNTVQLVPTKGAVEVVWEVANMKASGADTYTFAVYATYLSTKPPSTTPATAATVALSYAPTNGSASTSPVGVTTTNIPRFSTVNAGTGFFSALPCQTTLLFPFVSSTQASATTAWETGIAIANTGSDPLGTIAVPAGGTCTLSFYGTGAPPTMTTSAVTPGNTLTFLVSDPATTGVKTHWSGYMFAVCNFNYAHGFAFVEDDTRSMALGYLGLVFNSQTSSVPRGSFTLGESLEN